MFVVLTCLSLLAIDGWQSWEAHEIRVRDATVSAVNLSRSLAQHASNTIRQADTILIGLVDQMETDGIQSEKRRYNMQRLMETHVAELPMLHGLFVYDAKGNWLVNSYRVTSRNQNNADRDYFIYHRTHLDRAAHIGKPVRSRSTGEWILTVSRRVNHPDGSFAGVVLATLPLKYFSKLFETFDVGTNGAIALEMTNATLLVRHPFIEKQVGMDLKDAPLFRDYLPKATSGAYMIKSSPLDGQERLIAYHSLDNYPLLQVVSLSKQDILAGWRSAAIQHLLTVAALILVLGFLGFRMTRQISLRLKTETDLLAAQDELQQLNHELERMAMQDGLTGLANRRQFDLALNEEFNRAMRSQSLLSLVMIDVDEFKQYNDLYGHPAGDECLKKIAQAIKSCLRRPADLAARYGGEEFAVLLPETELAGALLIAERIRQAIKDSQTEHRGSATGLLTISCGVDALAPVQNKHIPTDLVNAADRSLLIAKNEGRNMIVSPLSRRT